MIVEECYSQLNLTGFGRGFINFGILRYFDRNIFLDLIALSIMLSNI